MSASISFAGAPGPPQGVVGEAVALAQGLQHAGEVAFQVDVEAERLTVHHVGVLPQGGELHGGVVRRGLGEGERQLFVVRSEEHTSELQSLMRTSYAVFCLKKKTNTATRYNI